MISSLLHKILLALLLLWQLPSNAQWGIHFTPFHLESVTKYPSSNLVIGVDRDLNLRSGIAIDLNYRLGDALRFFQSVDSYSGRGVLYSTQQRVFGLTYRSQFFFRDNDRFSFYMGPFLGFRMSQYDFVPTTNSSAFNDPLPSIKVSAITVPVGMRIGFRNELSGYCQDNYLGVGYLIGSDNSRLPTYVATPQEFSKLFIQLGLSFGLGWGHSGQN